MSETTEPDGKPAPEPEPTSTPAPESTPPETDEPAPAKEAEEERESRGDKRFAVVTAQRAALQRERDALRAENEFYRRQVQQQAPAEETPEQRYHRERAAIRAEVEAEIKKDNFHAHGNAQFPDWGDRTQRLIDMGADAGFAQLLIDLPVGEAVKVAGALAEDPAALQRISNIRTERGRAVELGKYAATIEDTPPARGNGHSHATLAAGAAAPQMTRAPAPIRPVTGRANPQFNEYAASGEQLVDVYLKRDLERARGGSRR